MYKLCEETFTNVDRDFQVVMSGSLPPNVPSDLYYDLIGSARRSGGMTILDASGEALLKGLEAGPDIVKPNADEATKATGNAIHNDSSAVRALLALREMGAPCVALSLGAQGMFWMNGNGGKA